VPEFAADASLTHVRISVVTPCRNAAATIGQLAASLRAQSDQNFEWVIADGCSTDATVDVLNASGATFTMSSQEDFGIYDALNRAIRISTGEYYIVAGADDVFDVDSIKNFRRAIRLSLADIIVAGANHSAGRAYVKRGPSWIVGEKAFIANHSLATAFRRSLHERVGMYSNRFPIAADSLFVLSSIVAGASRFRVAFDAGVLGGEGVSYRDWAGSATELFRVQLLVGRSLMPQVFLLLLRLLKGSSGSIRKAHDMVFRGQQQE
jgi:glycosyltransferase involved in cell wall biosynthesis